MRLYKFFIYTCYSLVDQSLFLTWPWNMSLSVLSLFILLHFLHCKMDNRSWKSVLYSNFASSKAVSVGDRLMGKRQISIFHMHQDSKLTNHLIPVSDL